MTTTRRNKRNNKLYKNIKAIKLSIASNDTILNWSEGEVTKAETINYKSLKPEPGGLFDEAIFGPVKDYECACGKFKKIKYRGVRCDRCGVWVTESIVRRERMGHIALVSPVAHIWMSKELPSPSKISLVLNISYKEVEQVLYFVNYIVLDTGKIKDDKIMPFKFKEVLDLTGKGSLSTRQKMRRVIGYIFRNLIKSKSSEDYRKGKIFYESLKNSSLPFSLNDAFNYIKKYTGFRVGIGAEAILELLNKIDLNLEFSRLNDALRKAKKDSVEDAKVKKILRQLETISWFRNSKLHPKNMILHTVPVIPPDIRPIIQLDGAKFTTSDINNFYRRVIIRNDRLRRILEDGTVPSIVVNNEKRLLQESVDALFDNSSRHKPSLSKDKRSLKSLTDRLKGKQGLFRHNLLGKRVDYSGRSVIVVGPELKMYEVGIPALMILKLFKPFIIHGLINKFDENGNEIRPIAASIRQAEDMIKNQDDLIWGIVYDVIKDRPVLLNRAPTLHRLGIQAFEPRIVDGKAIRLHPLVTTAFNADFDGDQMAVHVPLSDNAVNEARAVLLASKHILGLKDGRPIVTPTQDMVLGNYYLTTERKGQLGEGIIFSTVYEARAAYESQKVHLHAIVGISTKAFPNKKFACQGTLITTVGKIIFNDVLGNNVPYINDGEFDENACPEKFIVKQGEDVRQAILKHQIIPAFSKKVISKLIDLLYLLLEFKDLPKTLDNIKALGFKYSTFSSTTVSVFDIPKYTNKQNYFDSADQQVLKYKQFYNKGLLTDDERYKRVVKLWNNVKEKVSDEIQSLIKQEQYRDNSIVVMADSGARGNISNFTQLFGMRGLMSKSFNYERNNQSKIIKDTIEVPIKHSFFEGLTINEYFNSSYGARKGMTDTAMKTAKSGYMTRKLVDATHELIINHDDCGTRKGIVVEAIVETKTKSLIESLFDRIVNRYSITPIVDPETQKTIVETNSLITTQLAKQICATSIKEVLVRSVIYCERENGICQYCFGIDLSTGKLVELGTAVGVIAAQSIGEPGTQLTMRTFHTGGVSTENNLAQGFERLKQIFEVVTPKDFEKAVISEVKGTVKSITTVQNAQEVVIKSNVDERIYTIPFSAQIRVHVGDQVSPGSKITEGSVDIKQLLRIAGIQRVRQYMIVEIQKVYRIQGIDIADKYVEIIIRQLTNLLQVTDAGNSNLFVGQLVHSHYLNELNKSLLLAGKMPVIAINQVFGIDEAASKSNSFLSAASFQDTKKILTDAAVKNQVDYLLGLKENVIIGGKIPAGTGFLTDEELTFLGSKTVAEEY
ncbi:DNA-directed RNA polymerase subunit beta' [Mycoplasmoides genitalium M6320]|uniref:DNA-directed RNA polymerase subunit beta' n=1 Tax=Mycoplasmoides genitalium M6320 TaxID=662945 RepID=A0ABC7ZIY6_MYCGT|nr:DNA-directed RNA polymerase subunit beta' [Mycoplasmoides genitalium]AFQ04172.1 DNA-directed RNA polymerase subunit beta' [Mycoplasmoides genitalium M6320]